MAGIFTKEEIERARARVWEGTKKTEYKSPGEAISKKLAAREKKALSGYLKWTK